MENDLLGVIAAEATGETTVRATITATHSVTKQRMVYGTSIARVVVKHLTGLRLRSATNRLVLGGEQSVWVEGLGAGETPLTLAGIGIQFRWTAADPHVVALRGTYDEAGHSLDREESAFGARVVARSLGKTTVTVTVGALPKRLPSSLYSHLSATFQVTVIEPLRVLTPAALLMPPHSSFTIRTSKDGSAHLRYKLLGNASLAAATVDSHGAVFTRVAFGTAVILVQDEEASASVAIAVTVKPISHLELVPPASVARELPVGTTAEFRAVLRDDLGQAFDALPAAPAGSPLLTAESSFPDLVVIAKVTDNATVVVKALRPGQSVLRVVLGGSQVIAEDYVRVHVGHMVEPLSPLILLGGTVAFTTSFKPGPNSIQTSSSQRLWYSTNPEVLRIDGATGVATAVGVGESTVYYNGTVFTSTKATVARIGSIELDDDDGKTPLAVVSGAAPSRLHIRLRATDGHDFTRAQTPSILGKKPRQPQINHNARVQCKIVESEWASARAVTDSATGEYFCEVTPVTPPPLPAVGGGAPDTLGILPAATDSVISDTSATLKTFRVKFLSQFVVVGGPAKRDVQLTAANRLHVLDVSLSRPTLTVTPADPTRLSVTAVAPGVYNIEVLRSVTASFTSSVELVDSATGQRESIAVAYKHDEPAAPLADGQAAAKEPGSMKRSALFVSIVMLFVTALLWFGRAHPPPPPHTPFVPVGMTPTGPSSIPSITPSTSFGQQFYSAPQHRPTPSFGAALPRCSPPSGTSFGGPTGTSFSSGGLAPAPAPATSPPKTSPLGHAMPQHSLGITPTTSSGGFRPANL
jgi:hypothetical protein